MNYLGALIGAVIAGLVGAAVWAALAYYANVEIGWIAWGIGAAAGFGAAVGAKGDADAMTGGIAVLAAVGGILLGKFGAVHFAVEKELQSAELTTAMQVTDEDMIVTYADQVVDEWVAANKTVKWPEGMDKENASAEVDYPKAIWAEGKKRWNALDADAQAAARREQEEFRKSMVAYITSQAKSEGFKSTFSAFDILWFVLAVASAFAIGRGGGDGE